MRKIIISPAKHLMVCSAKKYDKTDIYLGLYRIHTFVFWALLRIFVPRLEIFFCSNHYFLVCIFKYHTSLRVNSVLEI